MIQTEMQKHPKARPAPQRAMNMVCFSGKPVKMLLIWNTFQAPLRKA